MLKACVAVRMPMIGLPDFEVIDDVLHLLVGQIAEARDR